MSTMPSAGSITDVAGIRVGHHQRTGRGWQTGTTAIIVPGGATPGVAVQGAGPGTRETDALAPQNLVQTIHGVCLSGGSAYGLAAAHGVMTWLEEKHLGFPVQPRPDGSYEVVPVVPAAVIFDLGRAGSFANRPDASFGARAARSATARQSRWGAVGAGTGARAGGVHGGVGTASTTVAVDEDGGSVTVGALAVVNAHGSLFDRSSGLPWIRDGLGLRRPSATDRRRLATALTPPEDPTLNTTIGVVATSARLGKAEASKLAEVAHDGLARAIRPAHSMVDGDTVFSLATGAVALPDDGLVPTVRRVVAVNRILDAAAETFAIACSHGVVSADIAGGAPTYRSLCPSAFGGGDT